MRIEIIHTRNPDDACDITVFIDGEEVSDGPHGMVTVYDVDPGRGYSRADWDEGTEADCAEASPEVGEALREIRDAAAETSRYITVES